MVLRGSISYNTEFQRPLQYKLELRHLPDNYTFMVLEDAMYSVQVKIGPSGQCLFKFVFPQGFEVKMARKLVPSITKLYIPSQLLVLITMFTHMFVTSYLSTQVGLSWLAFFVPPEVISGRMVLLITLLLMLTHLGEQLSIQ